MAVMNAENFLQSWIVMKDYLKDGWSEKKGTTGTTALNVQRDIQMTYKDKIIIAKED